MQTCRLCGAYNPRERAGRLGRYALTCDRCEARRGTHLTAHDAKSTLPTKQTAAANK
jgi:hypothetical protein